MTKYSRLSLFASLALAAAATVGARAQGAIEIPPDSPIPNSFPTLPDPFGTYPSLIEYSGHFPDGTEVNIRCAWVVGSDHKSHLGEYHQYTERNATLGAAKQIWRLDQNLVAVKSKSLNGGASTIPVVVQTFSGTQTSVTKACNLDTSKDTYSDCTSAPEASFAHADNVKTTDSLASAYCQNLFDNAYTQDGIPFGTLVNRPDYKSPNYKTPLKENAFYQHLRQTLAILTSPGN